ncbi:MAG: GFA family protein, partial [Alphaproteobacteria bacterium]
MSDTISGGCLCGNVRFKTTSEPAMQVLCHCVDCQTVSGSAFYTAYIVQLESVKLTKGEPGGLPSSQIGDGATIVAFA